MSNIIKLLNDRNQSAEELAINLGIRGFSIYDISNILDVLKLLFLKRTDSTTSKNQIYGKVKRMFSLRSSSFSTEDGTIVIPSNVSYNLTNIINLPEFQITDSDNNLIYSFLTTHIGNSEFIPSSAIFSVFKCIDKKFGTTYTFLIMSSTSMKSRKTKSSCKTCNS